MATAEQRMWERYQQERATGRTPTGAELDHIAGTNIYGRTSSPAGDEPAAYQARLYDQRADGQDCARRRRVRPTTSCHGSAETRTGPM